MKHQQITQSAITDYLSSIGRIAILSKDQQLIHGKNVREWLDWPGGRDTAPRMIQRRGKRSFDRMVESNLRIVVSIAKKYAGNGVPMEDLIQEGNMGLMVAAEKFEPSRGYCFSTCAYWWIRQNITRALANCSRTIRIPCNVTERIRRVRQAQDKWLQAYGVDATAKQLADFLDEDVEKVEQALNVFAMQPRSLDELLSGHESASLESVISSTTDLTGYKRDKEFHEEQLALVEELIEDLPEMEAYILSSIALRQLTQDEVAAELGMSRPKVGQVFRAAKKQLTSLAVANGIIQPETILTKGRARANVTTVVNKAKPFDRKKSTTIHERYQNTLVPA